MKGHIDVPSGSVTVVAAVVGALIGRFMAQTSGTFSELTKPGRKPKKGKK